MSSTSLLAKVLQNLRIRPHFWAIEEAILWICFSNVNLSSIVTPRSLRELETSRSSPQTMIDKQYKYNQTQHVIKFCLIHVIVLVNLIFFLIGLIIRLFCFPYLINNISLTMKTNNILTNYNYLLFSNSRVGVFSLMISKCINFCIFIKTLNIKK